MVIETIGKVEEEQEKIKLVQGVVINIMESEKLYWRNSWWVIHWPRWCLRFDSAEIKNVRWENSDIMHLLHLRSEMYGEAFFKPMNRHVIFLTATVKHPWRTCCEWRIPVIPNITHFIIQSHSNNTLGNRRLPLAALAGQPATWRDVTLLLLPNTCTVFQFSFLAIGHAHRRTFIQRRR